MAACQTTAENRRVSIESTKIVLEAEQFEGIAPDLYGKEMYCGRAEVAIWESGARVSAIALGLTDPGCAVIDDNMSIPEQIDQWIWLKKGEAQKDGESVMIRTLGTTAWMHFLRRKGRPCILFRYRLGESGDDLNVATEIVMGFYCDRSAAEIDVDEAKAFVKSIRIDRKSAS